jgi:hypothetical protein
MMTLLCIGPGGYVVYEQRKARDQKAAVLAIEEVGETHEGNRARGSCGDFLDHVPPCSSIVASSLIRCLPGAIVNLAIRHLHQPTPLPRAAISD